MSSIPYLWVEALPSDAGAMELPPEVARHVANVLRMRPGEALRLFDGAGSAVECRIEATGRDRASVRWIADWTAAAEPPIRVTVAQALPKQGAKLDSVLQHGTELGASAFRLFRARRSIADWDPRKQPQRLERCRRIVVGAAEQSHRSILPTVAWSESGPFVPGERGLVLHESGERRLDDVLTEWDGKDIALAVGPEGGFTDEEVATWIGHGAIAVHLGPRILRTETAALAALSRVLSRFGQ